MSEVVQPGAGATVPHSGGGADPAWDPMRQVTQARIGLRRTGNSLSTADVLRFQADHAAARDAVHSPLDVAPLSSDLVELGWGVPTVVTSRALSRADYLRRPDLGRNPASLDAVPAAAADVGIVVADGLSATAVTDHAVPLVAAIGAALRPEFTIAPPVIATQARVALGDHIGERLGVRIVVVIIGERPGLSVADSLGIYVTYQPRPGRRDSERNCISNIHPPEGLSYYNAARVVRSLVTGAFALGATGVALKDTSAAQTSGTLTTAES